MMDERGDGVMRRIFAALALLIVLPALAAAEIKMTELADSNTGSTLVVFEAAADAALLEAAQEARDGCPVSAISIEE